MPQPAYSKNPFLALQRAVGNQAISQLLQLGSDGRALDMYTRTEMETCLGCDFSSVRIHYGPGADWAAQALGAHAFTVGRDIFFGPGRYAPNTARGRRLLVHELEHVKTRRGRTDTVEMWSINGHRTITRDALAGDDRFSLVGKYVLMQTAPTLDYNRPAILQDMVSFWSGGSLIRRPVGLLAGGIIGAITPPEQGYRFGGVTISGALPQAILGAAAVRVPQELPNHGESRESVNEARMNQHADEGIAIANRCDLENGLVKLGYALHTAQDRGSHRDGYSTEYSRTWPHWKLDSLATHPEGRAIALRNSRAVINRFHSGLLPAKRAALRTFVTSPGWRPPVVETILTPGAALPLGPSGWTLTPLPGPEERGLTGAIPLITVTF